MPEQPTHTFFSSRCAEYKTPFGAVPAGQTVTWRLTVPERLGYVDPHPIHPGQLTFPVGGAINLAEIRVQVKVVKVQTRRFVKYTPTWC